MEERPPFLNTLPQVLGNYAQRDGARFHMPGHKGRGLDGFFREELSGWDVTELGGMDDLHAARGILARTADKYRKAYGAEHSFLSVGGSTAAIEAMLLSLDRSERLLVCRDCHRSVIGGAILSGIRTEFFTTPFDDTFGAPSLPDAALVEQELRRTGATAVFITSPNVYGFTADLPAIADVCRKHGALLLVDAAHGAHFPFSEKLPATPAGEADLWCHSQHKTMNALTQAATLHLSDCRIAPETVQRQLALIETSSPSYLLLASLDWALYTAQRQDWNAHAAHMAAYARVIGGMAGLSAAAALSGAKDHDATRLLIDVTGRGITGRQAQAALEAQNVFVETADERRLVLITTPADDPAWYPQLLDALQRLPYQKRRIVQSVNPWTPPERALPLREAAFAAQEPCEIAAAAGRVAGTVVNAYPQQMPLLLPGERVRPADAERLLSAVRTGRTFHGVRDGRISVLKEGAL